ncbi:MAG: AI-2E family transporter [Halioglobus sp.]
MNRPVPQGRDPAAGIPKSARDATAGQRFHGALTSISRVELRVLSVLLVLAVVYTLEIAQTFLIPLVLALFLSLLMSPLVAFLVRCGIPRGLGSAAVVLSLLALLGFLASVTVEPLKNWVENSPQTLRELEQKYTRFARRSRRSPRPPTTWIV